MLPNKTFTPAASLDIVRRRIWLIGIPPLVTLFLALLYSSTVPNVYQSDMLIAIIPQRVPDSVVRSTVTLRADERLDEISVEVKSRTNLERMILEMDLYPEERSRLPITDVVAMMNRDLVVGLEPQRRGPRGLEPPHAFHIRFTYPDPQMAALVTQKIGAVFVDENTRGRGALAQATNAFLESELDQARRRLEEQERRVEAFRERHGKVLPTQLQSNVEAVRGLQLQVQALAESIARDRDRKLMLERLYREASNDVPVATIPSPAAAQPGSPALPAAGGSLQSQLAAARSSLAALESRYTADHPDVVRTKNQIADLQQRVEAEAKQTVETGAAARIEPLDPIESSRRESRRQMLAEIESLDRQTAFKEGEERRVRAEIAEYQRRIEAVPGIESEWVALNRDYDTIQTAYRELLAKAQGAKMAVNLEQREIGEQFRVVDPARVPVYPITSIRGMINAGGFALGLLLGVGVAAFLEFKDKSFRTQADVLEVLALPVLAAVPRIVDVAERVRIRRRQGALAAVGIVCLAGAGYLTWTLKLWNSIV
jgi:polysaccharide chain length determinant protein (PEP-CTERM system associated)